MPQISVAVLAEAAFVFLGDSNPILHSDVACQLNVAVRALRRVLGLFEEYLDALLCNRLLPSRFSASF